MLLFKKLPESFTNAQEKTYSNNIFSENAAKPPPLCLPPRERRCIAKSGILISQPSPLGKGDRAAVDRVLSYIVDLRRISSLFFIPLVPYPARFARHLPHAGKALSVVILFLHVSCIRFDDARKPASSFRSLPHWGRGTASAVDRVLSQTAYLRRSSPLSFIPLEPYPARSARHLPHAGKALSIDILFPHMRVFVLTMREKRYHRIAAFPIGEGGPRSGG